MTEPRSCAAISCAETTIVIGSRVEPISYYRPLCYKHWREFDSCMLFECERCHRFDSLVGELSDEDLCPDCVQGREITVCAHGPVEYNDYYLYILKLDNGQFYVGQCNDLEMRLKEHQDCQTPTTRGRNPKLVWFQKWGWGRRELLEREREMQQWVKDSPREVRRMIADWQRLIKLIDLEK